MFAISCLRLPLLSDVVYLSVELLDLVVPIKAHELVEPLILLLIVAVWSPLSLLRQLRALP